ncbi:glycosyltransferase family 2 protein [Candidatus Woesearchaeota archaeon]|nr:glycosyltransferase family 2 protein [Candidatus Woesearchaeota archaeon]
MGFEFTMVPIVDIGYLAAKLLQKRHIEKNDKEISKRYPESDDFTIIMPVYNKAKNGMIKTLANFRYYKDKTLVVDDASTDNSAEMAEQRGYRVIRCAENGMKIGAVQEGLKHVQTKYTIVSDADIVLNKSEKTLEEVIGEIDAMGWDAGTCEIVSNPKQEGCKLILLLQYIDHKLGMFLGKRIFGRGKKPQVMVSGGFAIYKTDMLREVIDYQCAQHRLDFGGEDLERDLYLISKEKNIGWVDGFSVTAEAPKTWRSFRKQRSRWKKSDIEYFWKFRNLRKGKGKFLDKIANEIAFNHYFNAIGNPLKAIGTIPFIACAVYFPWIVPAFYLPLAGLSFIAMKSSMKKKEFKKYWPLAAFFPAYKLFEIAGTMDAYYFALEDSLIKRQEREREELMYESGILKNDK